jgi:Secretion system C-terminal sorting domain
MTKLLLKNKLKIVLSLMLFAALVPMQSIAQKKVLFICNSAFAPAVDASSSTADPLIAALSTDSRFAVTIITTADGITSVQKNGVADATALEVGGVPANTSPATIASFYANYDLVVTQESFGGTTAIWKSAGLFGIKNITIPVIYTKLFALQNTRALTDVANTPTGNVTTTIPAGNKLGVTVDPANQTNPLFTGVTFTANEVKLFKAGASDTGLSTGTTAIKAVDMGFNANITDITTGDLANQKITTLGYLTTANTPTVSTVTTNPVAPATVNPNSTLCINDVPGGTYFGTAGDMLPTTSRMILLSFNYGATVMGYGATTPVSNFTDDGIKIFKNAALILTNQPLATNENSLASDSVSVSPNPTSGVVNVNSTSAVKAITVFDTTGKQVATSKTNTVDLSSQAKGVYLVNVQTENGATTKKVVVE